MRYRKFIIENYRAIKGPLIVDVSGNVLTPIIGINECGKTTILHAIFAFDHWNDELNEGGAHLRNTDNLYARSPKPATVKAEISLTRREYLSCLKVVEVEMGKTLRSYRRQKSGPTTLLLQRNIKAQTYDIVTPGYRNRQANDSLAKEIIRKLPYILFFDDFRDSVEENVEIVADEDGDPEGWLAIFERLFERTDPSFSVFDLAEMEERQRKTVLSAVKRKLNQTLTEEWRHFRLDKREALKISIDFRTEGVSPASVRHFLRLEVIEQDSGGNEYFFFIRDRSKGFFWFFNFVMKLEFNPKLVDSRVTEAIYLLDEPGSYLHASAQSKLCNKLRQLSQQNAVLYCTHSHYLLDPEIIPFSSIQVAEKDHDGEVRLLSIHDSKESILDRRSAFQPVLDALQVKPFLLDLTSRFVILVEGICDFYAMEMFKAKREISFLPSVGAESIAFYISLMIAWQVDYRALWDADVAGLKAKAKAKAEQLFGSVEAASRFYDLSGASKSNARMLQDLFAGPDVHLIKNHLSLPAETSFEKMIIALFFSSNRSDVVNAISQETRARFDTLFDSLTAKPGKPR
jgi:hypothetical protein